MLSLHEALPIWRRDAGAGEAMKTSAPTGAGAKATARRLVGASRSDGIVGATLGGRGKGAARLRQQSPGASLVQAVPTASLVSRRRGDRKSTRLNSSH